MTGKKRKKEEGERDRQRKKKRARQDRKVDAETNVEPKDDWPEAAACLGLSLGRCLMQLVLPIGG